MNSPANVQNPWKVLIYTCVAVFAVTLDATILFVAFPAIRETYSNVSASHLSWILNAYTIAVGAALIPAGAFADKFGRKRLFLAGVAIFTFASAMCGLSQEIWFLIAARTLQGIGSALLTPTSLSLVLGTFPKEKRAIAIAIWSSVGALAAAIGPALGSVIIAFSNWRWVFFINIPIGIWCCVRGYQVLKEAPRDPKALTPSILSAVLSAIAVALVSLALVESKSWGLISYSTLGAAASGLIVFVIFVFVDAKNSVPLIDRSLFKSKNFKLANSATFIFSIAFSAMFLGSVFFLKEIWNYSTLETGLAMTVGPLAVVPSALLTGRYAGTRGHSRPLIWGGILYAAASLIRIFTLDWPPDFWLLWVPSALLTGVGLGMIIPSLSSSATFDLLPKRYSVGSGINNSIRQVGSVFGVVFAVVCLSAKLGSANKTSSFAFLFSGLVIASLMTALLGAFVKTAPTAN